MHPDLPTTNTSPFEIIILTLFPQPMGDFFLKGIFKKAADAGLFKIRFVNIRDFALDRFSRVDDYPYGDRQGMILKADVVYAAISSIENFSEYRLLYTCPKGPVLDQETVSSFLDGSSRGLILLCGYYEGVDERLFSLLPLERISIGDFVLSSGELPALMIAEAVFRQIPGVLGNPACLAEDSILSGVLEYPQFTAPKEFMGHSVPDVLLSGHHGQIQKWKRKEALAQTLFFKPQMLATGEISKEDQQVLTALLQGE